MLFNASERKGILVILFLITGIFVIPQHLLPEEPEWFILPEAIVPAGDSILVKKVYTPAQHYKNKYPHPISVELNSTDSASLVKIHGIGPYYASKILRYRQRLGGYYSVKQLKELHMTYFNVDSAGETFTVNPTLIQKSDLDSMSFKAILRHPYLEYEEVQLLFITKRQYGHLSYGLIEEKKVLPAYKLKKIKPYFK